MVEQNLPKMNKKWLMNDVNIIDKNQYTKKIQIYVIDYNFLRLQSHKIFLQSFSSILPSSLSPVISIKIFDCKIF